MASFNIFRRGSSAMSGILNVLGMAVAFAAFYIILVQVDYDLNFSRRGDLPSALRPQTMVFRTCES